MPSSTNDEEAAIARGRRQLHHMSQATTLDKDCPQKFAKRIVEPVKADDGKVLNKATGHNDVGALLKQQFDRGYVSKANAFQE